MKVQVSEKTQAALEEQTKQICYKALQEHPVLCHKSHKRVHNNYELQPNTQANLQNIPGINLDGKTGCNIQGAILSSTKLQLNSCSKVLSLQDTDSDEDGDPVLLVENIIISLP